jgi:putative flippase GtrA
MEIVKNIITHRVTRFALVGLANTSINFGVLNYCFYALQWNRYISAFIATLIAVAISFILNRSFVFGSRDRAVRQLVLFIVVTLTGVLLVQNMVYAVSNLILEGHEALLINTVHAIFGFKVAPNFVDINTSNILGAIGAMFWNYNGYKLFVFKDSKYALDEAIAEAA